jgi:hypothetical protein
MTDNVDVAVVGTELEEDVFRTVPLVDYFLYKIFAIPQLKANRPFVALPARVAVNAQLHLIIVAQNRLGRWGRKMGDLSPNFHIPAATVFH